MSNFRLEEVGVEVRHAPPVGATLIQVKVISEIDYFAFDRCPICLEMGPTGREHVPPKAIGGAVRTLTCARCNNDLGARVEDEFVAWYQGALGRVRFSSPGSGVLGSRRAPRIYYRTTDAGEFMLIVLGRPGDEIRQMLDHGEFELELEPPDPHRYRIAALKHAYLAACLHARSIPTTAAAETLRSELLAARDAPNNRSVPASSIAAGLQLGRSFAPQEAPPLAVCSVRTDDEPESVGVLLAGAVVVSWPDLSDS